MLFISNFVLELYNIYIMKRTILIFVISALVLLTGGYWFFTWAGPGNGKTVDTVQFLVIILVVIFALFVGYSRLKNARRGEPAEDELSRKILQKTAAISYYVSLYLWVFMLYLKDRVVMDTEELIGTGILGMAVTFALSWIILNFRGIRHE